MLLRSLLALLPLLATAAAAGTYTQIPNKDNFGFDIKSLHSTNINTLKTACDEILYCCGFSSEFGLLKFNCSNSTLGNQPGTILYVKTVLPPPLPPPPSHEIWPLPNMLKSKAEGNVSLNPKKFDFAMVAGSATSSVLEAALTRYHAMMFLSSSRGKHGKHTTTTTTHDDAATVSLDGCDVNLVDGETPLSLNVDESYDLSIPLGGRCSIKANTVWGALHALSTLAQLVRYERNGDSISLHDVPLKIVDAPRFAYRGLMIDSARHFLPMDIMLEHINLMESTKMNVLHWHMVDGQAFSFNSTSHPLLPFLSAYDPATTTYSHEDVRNVVEHGKARGVIVIPEFDMPSHDYAWTVAYPALTGEVGGGYDGIDPTSNFSYTFVDELFQELSTVFDSEHIHVGCDEVSLQSWNNSAAVRQWMIAHDIKDVAALETFWLASLSELARKYNRTLMMWHDPLQNGASAPKDAIVEVWGGSLNYANQLAHQGHQIVYAAPFYLDAVGKQWTDFYASPFGGQLVNTNISRNFLGGEAAMWSEWVDETNSIARVWPRTAAIAEVLWSKPSSDNNPLLYELSAKRLAQWRCRVRKWGWHPEPVGPMQGGPFYCAPDALGWEVANPNRRE
jgi:hexosaminidase